MKRAAALIALFATGLVSSLALAGGGLGWYSTSTETHTYPTTGTTETTVTETVLCPNGNPNTGGKDGHPGNDSCAPDETTPETSPPPQLTISIGVATQAPSATTTQATTSESTDTETETTSSPPPRSTLLVPRKSTKHPRKHHPRPPPICKPGQVEMGKCAPEASG